MTKERSDWNYEDTDGVYYTMEENKIKDYDEIVSRLMNENEELKKEVHRLKKFISEEIQK